MSPIAERLRGTGHPQEKVMASAQYLVEHLAEVPAIVIPTIIGRHDGNGRPGLFDSVIQAAWSFCLALRARGLGTTWVTAVLRERGTGQGDRSASPTHMTEIVLLPVAWTKGTEFGARAPPPGPRRSPTSIGSAPRPSTVQVPACGSRTGPGRSSRSTSTRRPAVLWSLISDIEVATRFSTESQGADWARRRPRARRALHRPQRPRRRRRVGTALHRRRLRGADVVRLAHRRSRTSPAPGGASNSSQPAPDSGCGSATRWALAPRARRRRSSEPDKESRILRRRLDEVQVNMQRTVEGIKALAES